MPLSQRTIDEMKAGMRAVGKSAGATGVDDEYMAACIRTGIRAQWLKDREKDGKVRIEKVLRPQTSGQKYAGDGTHYVVWVGKIKFEDPQGLMTGQWPSEVLIANVVLALGAGQGAINDAMEDL